MYNDYQNSKYIKKEVPVGRKRYYTTEYKPKYVWLDNLLWKLINKIENFAYSLRQFNGDYNRIEYQKTRYMTLYKTEYIERDTLVV